MTKFFTIVLSTYIGCSEVSIFSGDKSDIVLSTGSIQDLTRLQDDIVHKMDHQYNRNSSRNEDIILEEKDAETPSSGSEEGLADCELSSDSTIGQNQEIHCPDFENSSATLHNILEEDDVELTEQINQQRPLKARPSNFRKYASLLNIFSISKNTRRNAETRDSPAGIESGFTIYVPQSSECPDNVFDGKSVPFGNEDILETDMFCEFFLKTCFHEIHIDNISSCRLNVKGVNDCIQARVRTSLHEMSILSSVFRVFMNNFHTECTRIGPEMRDTRIEGGNSNKKISTVCHSSTLNQTGDLKPKTRELDGAKIRDRKNLRRKVESIPCKTGNPKIFKKDRVKTSLLMYHLHKSAIDEHLKIKKCLSQLLKDLDVFGGFASVFYHTQQSKKSGYNLNEGLKSSLTCLKKDENGKVHVQTPENLVRRKQSIFEDVRDLMEAVIVEKQDKLTKKLQRHRVPKAKAMSSKHTPQRVTTTYCTILDIYREIVYGGYIKVSDIVLYELVYLGTGFVGKYRTDPLTRKSPETPLGRSLFYSEANHFALHAKSLNYQSSDFVKYRASRRNYDCPGITKRHSFGPGILKNPSTDQIGPTKSITGSMMNIPLEFSKICKQKIRCRGFLDLFAPKKGKISKRNSAEGVSRNLTIKSAVAKESKYSSCGQPRMLNDRDSGTKSQISSNTFMNSAESTADLEAEQNLSELSSEAVMDDLFSVSLEISLLYKMVYLGGINTIKIFVSKIRNQDFSGTGQSFIKSVLRDHSTLFKHSEDYIHDIGVCLRALYEKFRPILEIKIFLQVATESINLLDKILQLLIKVVGKIEELTDGMSATDTQPHVSTEL